MKTRRVISRIVLTFVVLVAAACANPPTSTPAATVQPTVIPTELPQPATTATPFIPSTAVPAIPPKLTAAPTVSAESATAKYRELAIASLAESKDGLALAYLDQALALRPDWMDGYLYRGIVLAAARQKDEAWLDFNKVITQQPERADAYYLRAWERSTFASQQESTRALVEARTDMSKTLELSPTLADARALQATLDFVDGAQLLQSDRAKATKQMLAAQSALKTIAETEPGAADAYLMTIDYLVPQVLATDKAALKAQLEEAHTRQQRSPDDYAAYFHGGVAHLASASGQYAPDLNKAMELGHARIKELAAADASPLEVSRLVSLRSLLMLPFLIMDRTGYNGFPESYAHDTNYPKYVEMIQTYGEQRALFLDLFCDRPLVYSVDVSPDGKTIATLSENDPTFLNLWDASTGKKLREIKLEDTGYLAPKGSIDFSPDGKKIVAAYHGPNVPLIDVATGKTILTLAHTDSITTSSPGPGGDVPFSLSGGDTKESSAAVVDIVRFSPDGSRIVTVDSNGTIHIWDATTGKKTRDLDPTSDNGAIVWTAAFSPDSQNVIGGGPKVQVWDATSGKRLWSLPGYEQSWESTMGKDSPLFPAPSDELAYYVSIPNLFDVSADGSLIALSGSDPRIIDARTGEVVQKLTGHRDGVRAVAFSPDDSRVATASWDGTARIWDVKTGKQQVLTGHIGSVASVAFSPDGRRLITGGSDGAVRVWDAETGQELWNGLTIPLLL